MRTGKSFGARSTPPQAGSFVPVTQLIKEVNRRQRGWAKYFSFGYPRKAMREVNPASAGFEIALLVICVGAVSEPFVSRRGEAITDTWRCWGWFTCDGLIR
jgi:hypothetical protein